LSGDDAARVVAMVLQSVDYEVDDPQRLARRAQHIEFGLAAEDEFAAIAAWCGHCRLINKLDQAVVSSPDLPFEGTVPDLTMVVEHEGVSVSLLVEVKTTEDLELRLSEEYLAKLRAYAEHLALPLLVAWRPRQLGWWCLFDPADVPRQADRDCVRIEDVLPECLMSHLLGDFSVVPKKGSRLVFSLEPLGPRESAETGFTQTCRITSVEWRDSSGAPGKPTDGVALAIMATSELVDTVGEEKIQKSWVATGSAIYAQQLLRASVGFGTNDGERIHWRRVAEDMEDILGIHKLAEDVSACFGTFSQYLMHTRPRTWPSWYPESWRVPATPEERGDG
jgi:Holliday junction resolvase